VCREFSCRVSKSSSAQSSSCGLASMVLRSPAPPTPTHRPPSRRPRDVFAEVAKTFNDRKVSMLDIVQQMQDAIAGTAPVSLEASFLFSAPLALSSLAFFSLLALAPTEVTPRRPRCRRCAKAIVAVTACQLHASQELCTDACCVHATW
jgi:hypothetical protein